MITETTAHIFEGAREVEVLVYGECFRAVDGAVECRVLDASTDERTLTPAERAPHESAWRTKLVGAYLAETVRASLGADVTGAWSGPEDAA